MSGYFGENRIEEGHGRRSLHSGVVTIAARAVNACVQIGSVLFLARLLSPEDYGLVSMVTAMTGFAPLLVSLGTPDAVSQRARISEEEIGGLFWLTMAVGCGSALLVAAAGPLIARFYGEPRLTAITVVSALTFVASALSCQHYALMRRAMKFPELAVLDVSSNLLSAAAAIGMAFYGLQYWALVMRPVTLNLFLAAGVWLRCGWLPRRPVMTPGVKEIVRFGLNSTGFTMSDFAGRSIDKVTIGYRGGAQVLGYYQNALFVYDNLIDLLLSPLHGVAIASLSKVRDDLIELRRLWRKALSTLVFYAMPLFGILAVVSQDLIVLLLGTKWASAGALLSILALRGIPHSVERTLGWLHVAAGRTDRWMRWGLLALGAHLFALLCGLPFGSVGVIVAFVACMWILFVPAIAFAGQPLGIGANAVIRVVWRQMAGASIAALAGFLLRSTLLSGSSGIIRIAVLTLAYATIYFGIVVWLLRLRTPLTVALALAQNYLPPHFTRFMGASGLVDGRRFEHP